MPDTSALPLAPQGVQLIPHHLIDTSPLNPRKAVAADELAQFADSIVAHGVLHNVVLRPHPAKPGRFELVAGERRWRAACLAVRDKRLPADFALPAAIRAVDDTALLLLATAENVGRADLSPLEEGRAFKALLDRKVPKADIARQVGRTVRHVELRLALVDRLAKPAQDALQAGAISLAQARVIAQAPKDRQEAIVKQATPKKDGGWHLETADELRRAVARAQVPVDAALFPRDLYTGEVVAADDDPKRLMFADVAQFARLQKEAIAALKAELRKKWPWVDVVEAYSHQMEADAKNLRWVDDYEVAKSDKAGAIIMVSGRHDAARRPRVLEGVIKPSDPAKGGRSSRSSAPRAAAKPDKAKERERKAAEAWAAWIRTFKNRQLQRWLLANPHLACGLAIERLNTRGGSLDRLDDDEAPEVDVAMKRLGLRVDFDDETTAGKVARGFAHKSVGDVVAALAAMFAAGAGVPGTDMYGSNRTLGDREAAVTLLRAVGFDPLKGWSMDKAFLDACPIDVRERIAADLKITAADGHRIGVILAAPQAKTYRPPWLELGTAAELAARLKKAAAAAPATAAVN